MAIESVKQAVGAAIERAAQATGADFSFLMRTAKRESGFNPSAHAPSSSAAGLFQFVEQTWLGALKRHGAKFGYGDYADMIQGSGDHLSVAGAEAKKAVMALRLDPKAASLMAGELASDNAVYLKGRVGREPTAGELYAAHFLGPKGSADLIEASRARPGAEAAALFPDAASANPAIFYRDGRASSVAEVYANLTQGQSGAVLQPAVNTASPQAYLHHDIEARLNRTEQERQLMDMILGVKSQDGQGAGFFGEVKGGSGALASSMFSSEMLTLLSQARHGGPSRT